MRNELYWADGPWPGRLAIGPRPRGGDWLEDDVSVWRQAGIDAVLSLLTPDEENSLDLTKEGALVKKRGMSFASLPIPDRQVPVSPTELAATLDKINATLASGKNVLIHCRQGIGRTGLVAACMLVTKGWDSLRAIEHLSAVRGVPVPETLEQRNWIEHYAAILAGTR
jgi:protein-tyrosine phosphatase